MDKVVLVGRGPILMILRQLVAFTIQKQAQHNKKEQKHEA